jgi:hypothetical protein
MDHGACPHLPNAEAEVLIKAGKAEYVRPPVAKMDSAPKPETNHGEGDYAAMTKAQLEVALETRGIEFDSRMRKDELIALLTG